MAATKVILNVQSDEQLDEQLDDLCSGLIATEQGLRVFVMAVEKATAAIEQEDYPHPPSRYGSGRGAAIYEGYRLGMARMAKLLLAGGREGLDISVIRKD